MGMTLEQALHINSEMQKVNEAINLIGFLDCEFSVNKNILIISISKQSGLKNSDKRVGDFVFANFQKYIRQELVDIYWDGIYFKPILGYCDTMVTITYDCRDVKTNITKNINGIADAIIKSLYYAIDESKIEFAFQIEEDENHDIPNEIYWELDTWNDELIMNEEEDKCVPPENLRTSKFKKDCLYGISLGYYPIDLSLFETDITPELIGVVLDSTEDFCYVTAYEDADYIYIYSTSKLTEDNIFDIEEGLFNLLSLIKKEGYIETETLEDMFFDILNRERRLKMVINFEEEYCIIMCKNGINIEIDRETALDLARQVQNFYEDGFDRDYNEDDIDF